MKMLCNLYCLKARLKRLCNELSTTSSPNLVSRQLKLCDIFIFGMAYYVFGTKIQVSSGKMRSRYVNARQKATEMSYCSCQRRVIEIIVLYLEGAWNRECHHGNTIMTS